MTTTIQAEQSVECWRPTYLDPNYEVSDLGRVRNARTGRELRATPNGLPYREIRVRVDGKRTKLRIHRAVCWAFHGPPPTPAHQAAHTNGDPLDNRAENLRWATPSENFADGLRHGRNMIPCWDGDRRLNGKLTAADAIEIRQRYAQGGLKQRELAEAFGVSQSQISQLVNGLRWAS